MTARVLVVQHEDDDPIHLMGSGWASTSTSAAPTSATTVPPSLQGYAALVVMGGAMGANDDATAPWLPAVKELIREAAADARADARHLPRPPARDRRPGWRGRCPTRAGVSSVSQDVGWEPAAHLDELFSTVATPRRGAHWNDDIVTRLPEGAVLMARASTGEVQAARHAPTVWGVQWHPEVDEPLFRGWLVDGNADPALAERDPGRPRALGRRAGRGLAAAGRRASPSSPRAPPDRSRRARSTAGGRNDVPEPVAGGGRRADPVEAEQGGADDRRRPHHRRASPAAPRRASSRSISSISRA